MSICKQTEERDALADWTPIQTPDGLWCVWSERTQLPIKLGTKQAILLPDVSKALGSIDKAQDAFRAAHADPDRWDRLLASLPPATARFLASKLGPPVARREVVELRQMPVSSVSNPYVVGDQPPELGEVVKAAPAPAAPPAASYGRGYRQTRRNTPQQDNKIRALHAQGLHTSAIAAQLRCKEQTVRNAYTRLGITGHRKPTESYKPRISPPHPQDAQIKALHAEGLHNAGIARRCALGERVVDGRLKALGLVRHKAWQPKAAPPAPPAPEVKAPAPPPAPAAKPKDAAPRKAAAPPVPAQVRSKAASGGRRAAVLTKKGPSPAAVRRQELKREAYERGLALGADEAWAAYEQTGSYAKAARKLKVSVHRLEVLIGVRVSAAKRQREQYARRLELTRAAVLALKAVGAALGEVYGLVRAQQPTIKAIYNGEAP
jgi:hypothetical protein